MASFKGRFNFTLDPKNRLNIPAKMRASFADDDHDTVVMTRGFERCIYIYPLSEWRQLEDRMRNLSILDADTRKFIRLITGNAEEDQLDKQGRIVVPEPLLTFAGIEREILIIGMLNWIEVWNPKTYQQIHADFDLEKTASQMRVFS